MRTKRSLTAGTQITQKFFQFRQSFCLVRLDRRFAGGTGGGGKIGSTMPDLTALKQFRQHIRNDLFCPPAIRKIRRNRVDKHSIAAGGFNIKSESGKKFLMIEQIPYLTAGKFQRFGQQKFLGGNIARLRSGDPRHCQGIRRYRQ